MIYIINSLFILGFIPFIAIANRLCNAVKSDDNEERLCVESEEKETNDTAFLNEYLLPCRSTEPIFDNRGELLYSRKIKVQIEQLIDDSANSDAVIDRFVKRCLRIYNEVE